MQESVIFRAVVRRDFHQSVEIGSRVVVSNGSLGKLGRRFRRGLVVLIYAVRSQRILRDCRKSAVVRQHRLKFVGRFYARDIGNGGRPRVLDFQRSAVPIGHLGQEHFPFVVGVSDRSPHRVRDRSEVSVQIIAEQVEILFVFRNLYDAVLVVVFHGKQVVIRVGNRDEIAVFVEPFDDISVRKITARKLPIQTFQL